MIETLRQKLETDLDELAPLITWHIDTTDQDLFETRWTVTVNDVRLAGKVRSAIRRTDPLFIVELVKSHIARLIGEWQPEGKDG